MRTLKHLKKLAIPAAVGAIAVAGAACEVEDDDPEVIEQTTNEGDVVDEGDTTVTEEETVIEETETTEPTETES